MEKLCEHVVEVKRVNDGIMAIVLDFKEDVAMMIYN